MPLRSTMLIVLLTLAALIHAAQPTEAQLGGTCTPLVEQALEAIGNNCAGLGRNAACYGFNRVNAIFSEVRPDQFFSQPADIAELLALSELITAPLNVDTGEWGIAVLNVQADLPDALPGQAVNFLLFGDVAIENAVDPALAAGQAETEPIAITTRGETFLRTRAMMTANTSATVPAGETLQADRISEDGSWLRVVYADRVGWVLREDVETSEDLTTLSTPSTTPFTPMQAIRLSTSVMGVNCDSAPPSLLVVQGPQQMTVNLSVNGAELNIGSTIALWTFDTGSGPVMQLAVIDGGVYLADGTYIPAGFTAQVTLDASGNVTGVWTPPRPISLEEWLLFEPLEGVPDSLLNYPIDVPSELIAELQPTPTPTVPANPPPPVQTPVQPPQITTVDCSGLRPTSPLDGLPFGGTTFFWDGVASGAVTGYRVNVYRDGVQAASFSTSAGSTRVSGDLSALPLFGVYTWEVQALVNGVAVCTAPANVSMQRAFPPNQPQAQPAGNPFPPASTPDVVPFCNENRVCELGENETCSDCRQQFICNFDKVCDEGEDSECTDCLEPCFECGYEGPGI